MPALDVSYTAYLTPDVLTPTVIPPMPETPPEVPYSWPGDGWELEEEEEDLYVQHNPLYWLMASRPEGTRRPDHYAFPGGTYNRPSPPQPPPSRPAPGSPVPQLYLPEDRGSERAAVTSQLSLSPISEASHPSPVLTYVEVHAEECPQHPNTRVLRRQEESYYASFETKAQEYHHYTLVERRTHERVRHLRTQVQTTERPRRPSAEREERPFFPSAVRIQEQPYFPSAEVQTKERTRLHSAQVQSQERPRFHSTESQPEERLRHPLTEEHVPDRRRYPRSKSQVLQRPRLPRSEAQTPERPDPLRSTWYAAPERPHHHHHHHHPRLEARGQERPRRPRSEPHISENQRHPRGRGFKAVGSHRRHHRLNGHRKRSTNIRIFDLCDDARFVYIVHALIQILVCIEQVRVMRMALVVPFSLVYERTCRARSNRTKMCWRASTRRARSSWGRWRTRTRR
ncbi:uncharacterized protein [Panulirus ornatus]|uniref:uncharacterized protein n=1 Tax=Panulirus ornatus TaxID=150431 RepID=UPI003A8C17D1